MYTDHLMDFYKVVEVFKCINCGAVIDHVILENRKNSPHADPDTDQETASLSREAEA